MWKLHIKVTNIIKMAQMTFSDWYFAYTGYLPCYITDYFQVMAWLLSTSTGLTNFRSSLSEKPALRNFANHFWYLWSFTAPSLKKCRNIFCIWILFLYFFKIKMHIKVNRQKYATLTKWMLSQYNRKIDFYEIN